MDFPTTAVFVPGGRRGTSRLVVETPERSRDIPPDDPAAAADRLFAASGDEPVLYADLPPAIEEHFLAVGGRGISLNRISALLLPGMEETSLSAAAETLAIQEADAPTQTARHVFQALLDVMDTVPAPALELARRLLSGSRDPLMDLLEEAVKKRVPGGVGDARAVSDYSALFMSRELHFKAPPKDETAAYLLDDETVSWHFSPGGPLAGVMEDYEERPGQTRMACLCARALRDGAPLVVEAGTGVGKSLAYLYPAAVHALSTGKRVLVCTNTKTLQGQLLGRDIPLLAESLPVPVRAAMLKGRRNYLCLRKFLRSLTSTRMRLTAEEAFGMAALVLWASGTVDGDISENNTFLSHAGPELWLSLAGTHEECLGRQCRWFKACFLRQTRARAHASNIVVVNYALLMASLSEEGELIPPYDDAVLDEAQNIENSASEAMSILVARWRLRRFLRSIGGQDGGGLIDGLGRTLRGATDDEKQYRVLYSLLEESRRALDACRDAGEWFFEMAGELVQDSDDVRVRYDAETRNPSRWEKMLEAKQALVSAMAQVALPLEKLLEETQPAAARRRDALYEDDADLPDEPSFTEHYRELTGQLDMAREFMHDVDFVVSASEKRMVYWLEGARRGEVEFRATPVDVSGLLFEGLYERKRSVIFTSATLTVDGGFDFFLARSGAVYVQDIRTEQVESPFNHERQTRFLVPTFLPEPAPGSQDFPLAFADVVGDAVKTSEGRALVLFTSHRMLAEVAEALRPRLEAEGLEFLQQEVDGPREALLGRFRRNIHSVLLGTASFWEGIDVKGESLSVLILAKLPFPVHTDPLIQARQDDVALKGDDPFLHYLLPLTVLRLRQGFGRLIRSRQDRGVVIVADKRLLTRRYGGTFFRSLPVRHLAVNSPEVLTKALSRFFKSTSADGDVEYYFDDEDEAGEV